MRVIIENQINDRTIEKWEFNIFDMTAVLVYWGVFVKPIGKRKWVVESFWDNYARRDSSMMKEHPPIPESIRTQAVSEMAKMLSAKTWSEWKSR